MSYATIYRLDGSLYTDGVQGAASCDEARNMAREIARDTRVSLVVEDRTTEECYRVTPAGHIWRPPRGWTPVWESMAETP